MALETQAIPIGTRAARRAAQAAATSVAAAPFPRGVETRIGNRGANSSVAAGSPVEPVEYSSVDPGTSVEPVETRTSPPPQLDAFVRFRDVTKVYHTGSSGGVNVTALDGLTFDLPKGQLVVIVGPSGAGKTTLLNVLGGMDSPTSGDIWFNGQDVAQFTEKQLTEYRRHDVGFVFQFYNLMPNLTALENVELATEICRNPHSPQQVLADVGLAGRGGSFPAQLSGGEQQRVSIARAVAKNPSIILCDEPTGALDYETGKRILALLRDICTQFGTTVVIVTHNSALKAMADTVITIKNGRAVKIVSNPDPTPIAEIEW